MKNTLLIILLAFSCAMQAQSLERQLKEWAANYVREDANIKPSTLVSCSVSCLAAASRSSISHLLSLSASTHRWKRSCRGNKRDTT